MRTELDLGLAMYVMSCSVEKSTTGKVNQVQEVDHDRSSGFMNYQGYGKWWKTLWKGSLGRWQKNNRCWTRHPGQVPQRGTRAGIQKEFDILKFHWIPDLVRLGGLVRKDGFGEL